MSMAYTSPRAGDLGLAGRAGDAGQAAESAVSAVSWSAILAGAFGAVGVTVLLASLASGLGLASLAPWMSPDSNASPSATTLTATAAVGLVVVQWLSSAVGGFIAGRLRIQSVGVHNHEVFFRDTAHGFLAWAVATLIGVTMLASAASSVVGGTVNAASNLAGGAARGVGAAAGPAVASALGSDYSLDRLFRSDNATPGGAGGNGGAADPRAEAGRILANGLRSGDVSDEDRTYLARMVAPRAGISAEDARKRVDGAVDQAKAAAAKAREAADAARKAAARFSILTALSMLIGAFVASAAAAHGGRMRDEF